MKKHQEIIYRFDLAQGRGIASGGRGALCPGCERTRRATLFPLLRFPALNSTHQKI